LSGIFQEPSARATPFKPRRSLPALCVALLAACAGMPQPPAGAPADARPGLYVVRRGWHVDIALDAADLTGPLAAMRREFPGARYLVFGFGDRGYLLHRGNDPGRSSGAVRALWPGPALLLVTGLSAPPADAFGAGHVIGLAVGPRAAGQLQEFVWQSLAPSPAGLRPLAPGPYGGSAFFEASGRYDALDT
jgi:hypothetical protein